MQHLTKIPKVAHFYWSNNLLSYLRYLTIKTFSKFNPDWEIKYYFPKVKFTGERLWNREFPGDLVGKDYHDEVALIPNTKMIEIDFDAMGIGNIPEVYRSDILRLQLLGIEGGLWVDMDIIFFKSLKDAWFNNLGHAEIDTIISYHPTRNHYSIGFLGSSANNPFYTHLYQKSMERILEKGDYQWLGIMLWHAIFNTPKEILDTYPDLKILDIQMDLCYSLDSTQINLIYEQDTPLTNHKTIAFHWYAGHPLGPKMENLIKENDFGGVNNTITSTIKAALAEENI